MRLSQALAITSDSSFAGSGNFLSLFYLITNETQLALGAFQALAMFVKLQKPIFWSCPPTQIYDWSGTEKLQDAWEGESLKAYEMYLPVPSSGSQESY